MTAAKAENPADVGDVRMQADDSAIVHQIVIVALLMNVDNFDVLEGRNVVH